MPNIFELMNLRGQPSPNTYLVRQERIKREGSKFYTWTVPATGPGATALIHVETEFPDSRKYSPLDYLELTNNEAVIDLSLIVNQNETFLVPASSIKYLENYPLWHLQITNNHAADTTTLGDIVVQLRKAPRTIDQWARRQP